MEIESDQVQWRLSWRPGQPARGESLWSVLHKLCWLNHIRNTGVIRNFFRADAKVAVFQERPEGGRLRNHQDLRFIGAIDVQRISRLLNVSEEWIALSTLDRVGTRSRVRRASVPFLRYCPTCLEKGFHTVVFQLAAEKCCTVHGDLLIDFCPKCGSRIPFTLPEVKGYPYTCRCGYRLWWGVSAEEWETPFSQRVALALEQHVEDQLNPTAKSNGAGSQLLWLTTTEPTNERAAAVLRRRVRTSVTRAVITHSWGKTFDSSPRFKKQFGSVYAVAPADDANFRAKIFDVFRRIERTIYRKFPCSRRKRWLTRTKAVRYFDEIGQIEWSREFMAYLLWKSYWLDSPWASFPRGKEMEASVFYKPQLSKVYWRFLCHSRLLRPMTDFTSADEWSQLHYFSLVAFATWRAALRLVNSVKLRCYPFRTLRRRRLEKAPLPFVVLVKVGPGSNTFELRLLARTKRKPKASVEVDSDCVVACHTTPLTEEQKRALLSSWIQKQEKTTFRSVRNLPLSRG